MKIIKKDKNPKNKEVIEERQSSQVKSENRVSSLKLSKNVDENFEKFQAFLKESTDAVFRKFKLGRSEIDCALVYIDGLIDKSIIHESILKPMMFEIFEMEMPEESQIQPDKAYNFVLDHAISVADIKETDNLDEAILFVMSGEAALMVDGFDKIIIVSARGWATRGITDPETESVIRGAKEGFTETLRTNTALLRRKCKDPNMVIRTIRLGRRSKTDVAYVYIKGITNPGLLEELEERLNQIDIDMIIDSGHLEQLIQDHIWSPMPQIQATERPDKAIANLMEGRIIILVDNSPFALLIPTTFAQFFQSPEDYNERWFVSTFIRVLRWISSFLAVFTPALYIAVVTYHPGLIPTRLALSIAATRAGVPFPSIIEAFLMETTIELLRESGARLPSAIGQTIGIVGGIIIGDAAVRAGLTSPIMVIVVALTAIASFVIPTYSAAVGLRTMRFPLMVLASFLGLYGVMIGFIVINIHLVSIKSFGMNYMTPQAPSVFQDMKDFIIRVPARKMQKRPIQSYPIDMIRMDMD
ncbi:MAG: spore germination protein [Caldicoprobacterales bacterium]|jgi:spore germination protein|nr:spore germination protein [Clostridiales bacterium]